MKKIQQLMELFINKKKKKSFVIKFNIVVLLILTISIILHSNNYNRSKAVQQIKINQK